MVIRKGQDELVVWYDTTPIATISRRTRRGAFELACQYTEEAERRFGPGAPVISVSMPIQRQAYSDAATTRFFDGLLPEGQARAIIAYDLHLGSEDTFGLLRELGRDCAGALVILPVGEAPPDRPSTHLAREIDDDELARRIDQLRSFPLGVDQEVRVSLAGMQEKLLLTGTAHGWGLPMNGAPSTHIFKPESALLPGGAGNEAFCLRLAHNCGLNAAKSSLMKVGPRDVLIVRRYDREITDDGSVLRLHQEDLCQALGILPSRKYEEAGGPTLRRIAQLLDRYGTRGDLETLLGYATFGMLVGNADAHGRNFSLLHHRDGAIRLAPLYDVMSTTAYDQVSRTAGMSVNGVARIDSITPEDLLAESVGWGISEPTARDIVWRTMEACEAALEESIEDVHPAEEVITYLRQRLTRRTNPRS